MSVFTQPGCRLSTVGAASAHSATRLRVMEFSAALLARYSARPPASLPATLPSTELMKARVPPGSRLLFRRWARRMGATALVRNSWAISASVACTADWCTGP